ncbi:MULTISPECIES: tyrosine-type recombinase/integrase [Paraburkholderia]|uniref:Tyrosine-type recombinase/integrase n=1 Tax=Paraburkholderia madseniana TaxID=2599607 RepID=A0AAP5EWN8_9BURK|nr:MULTISPECIES: tyrosine-type recombinase/integrase [Paraburkholderia]MCX4146886.1 tyrosine-type recombinase/integrase [Paraburkholderia madseniana]MDN7149832.1 tyrosine-type recombinase/integrase [Paraburkholderia sp. WS6]MDQ6408712.1 tyrosine-type recombinase/integrase [Paraburkholderia madseniana]
MATLTDLKARNLKPDDAALPHGGVTGLTLHPSSSKGHGKWVLRFVSPVSRKRRNAGLGSYPEVGIADAGKLAAAMREQIASGIDPLEAKAAEAIKPKMPTFKGAAETLHAELLPGWKNAKHGQQWINTLTQYAFPIVGSMPLDAIQPRHIADVLRPIWLEKAETAGRVKQRMQAVMAWGWAHGYCNANPVDVVDLLLPQQPGKAVRTQHQPAMPWRVIPAFVGKHLRGAHRYDVTRPMLEFLILTACRSGEVRGLVWQEVDLTAGVWTIPAERMKAKLPHRVPLAKRAVEILKGQQGLHEDLAFPSLRDGVELSDMVLTSFLRRVEAPSDTPGRFATAHGYRSSFRDWCSERGYPRDLAERALAHSVQNKVEAAYHRTDLMEQRRPMMEAWANFVTGTQTSISDVSQTQEA